MLTNSLGSYFMIIFLSLNIPLFLKCTPNKVERESRVRPFFHVSKCLLNLRYYYIITIIILTFKCTKSYFDKMYVVVKFLTSHSNSRVELLKALIPSLIPALMNQRHGVGNPCLRWHLKKNTTHRSA